MVKVDNLLTTNGNIAQNQYIITIEGSLYFQSYNSKILVLIKDNEDKYSFINVYPEIDYSKTTSKYSKAFLKQVFGAEKGEGLYKAIKNKEFAYDDLYICYN